MGLTPVGVDIAEDDKDEGAPGDVAEDLGGQTGPLMGLATYRRFLRENQRKMVELAHRYGWTFMVHHTDRPASEPLLSLLMRLQGSPGGYRWNTKGSADVEGAL